MSDSNLIALSGGLIVPTEPLRLLWDLEARGLTFRLDGDDIIVNPRGRLTEEDRAALRRWKPHVLAILASCDEAVH